MHGYPKKHDCPDCGEQTYGTYSEGGLKWSICENCMAKLKSQNSAENGDAEPYEWEPSFHDYQDIE